MELWIRSRNKYILIKADFIYIEPVSIKEKDGYYIKTKHGINNGYSDYTLGHYKTEKRALEVLDEIQNILLLKDMYVYDKEELLKGWEKFDEEEIKSLRKNLVVYEMPKE